MDDDGSGISEENERKLFQPFFTTKAQGTGIGLSFCRRVLEDNGGWLEYIRKPGHKGATFMLALPAKPIKAERGRDEARIDC